MLESFITGAKELEKEGVRAITTNCGFLAMFHNEMASAVNVPVFTSSLMQVPLVYAMLQPTQKVGIITINAKTLSQKHLAAVGADKIPHVILGTEDEEEFSRVILDNEMQLDVEKSKAELVKIAARLILDHPDVGAVVLECTNMTPYAAAIQEKIGDSVKQVVAFVKDLKIEDLPQEVIDHTKLVLLDTIGAMLAASNTNIRPAGY